MKNWRVAIVLTALCAAAAGQVKAPHHLTNDLRKTVNIWGGEGAVLTVGENTSKIEFDCANGEMLRPLGNGKDEDGDFRVQGTFQREPMGPARKDRPNATVDVIYKGSVEGDTIRFRVVLPDGQEVGPFILHRGHAGRLTKCY